MQESPRCEAQGFAGKAAGVAVCMELGCVPLQRVKCQVILGFLACDLGKWDFGSLLKSHLPGV